MWCGRSFTSAATCGKKKKNLDVSTGIQCYKNHREAEQAVFKRGTILLVSPNFICFYEVMLAAGLGG